MRARTFVVLVEDQPGVLDRVASLFRRRVYNIESLAVGHTDRPGGPEHGRFQNHRHAGDLGDRNRSFQ